MSSEQLQRLEADLAAVEARLAEPGYSDRTPQHRLDQERQFARELRGRIETERQLLASQIAPVVGGLPAASVGRWAPLPLFDRPTRTAAEGELPLAALDVDEAEQPDREAIAREVTTLLRSNELVGHLLTKLARRWLKDGPLRRLSMAALRTYGYHRAAEQMDGVRPRAVAVQDTTLPPTPFLTTATEFPDEFDGLTGTQRRVLDAVRIAAPHGGPFVRLGVIASEVAAQKQDCTPSDVERGLISLGHPSLRRVPLVELQGLTGRCEPNDIHCTHARLTREGLEVLEQTFPLPLILINGAEGRHACIPPHSPKELAKACSYVLETPGAGFSDGARFLEGPDFPDGGVLQHSGVQNFWQRGQGELTARAKIGVESDQKGHARIVIAELPWPLSGKTVQASVLALQIDGVTAVEDHSSATTRRVIVELEHLAFSGQALDAIRMSRLAELTFQAELLVDGPTPRRLDLVDLLRAHIEHRREVAVKKLDRAVAKARLKAQDAEAVCLALELLEPVLAVMRAADDDEGAVKGLMNFMSPQLREALSRLPFPASHDYAKGFTEQQARYLMTVRRLPSRRPDSARSDWAALLAATAEATALLSSRQAILDVVREELRAAVIRFDEPRRTEMTWRSAQSPQQSMSEVATTT